MSSVTWRLVVFVVVPGAAYWVSYVIWDRHTGALVLLALALGSVVPLLCMMRGDAAEGQKKLFDSIDGTPLSETEYAGVAERYFRGKSDGRLLRTPGFVVPIGFLTALIFLFALTALFGAEFDSLLATPNIVLGGIDVSTTALSAAQIKAYQAGTMLTVSMAALGAYVIVVLRLIKRINNFDIDPISFYFFSVHILQAVVVASVVRHLLPVVVSDPSLATLAGIGFAIGLQPDVFMIFVARWARENLSIAGSPRQIEPDESLRPTNFSLSMLEGMTKEKRARLEELDIDNSQALAAYNPYVMWARTAFQMQQIMDWTGQARLYVIVNEDGLKKLRPYGIRDVFGFVEAAKGPGKAEIAQLLGIPPAILDSDITNLEHDSSYTRLVEVRAALLATVGKPSGSGASAPAASGGGPADPPADDNPAGGSG